MALFTPNVQGLKAAGDVEGLAKALRIRFNANSERSRDRAAAIRLEAAQALGELGDAQAVSHLVEAVIHDDQPTNPREDELGSEDVIRQTAIAALFRVGAAAISALVHEFERVSSPTAIQQEGLFAKPLRRAIFAMGEVEHGRSEPRLLLIDEAARQAPANAMARGTRDQAGFSRLQGEVYLLRSEIERAIRKIQGT